MVRPLQKFAESNIACSFLKLILHILPLHLCHQLPICQDPVFRYGRSNTAPLHLPLQLFRLLPLQLQEPDVLAAVDKDAKVCGRRVALAQAAQLDALEDLQGNGNITTLKSNPSVHTSSGGNPGGCCLLSKTPANIKLVRQPWEIFSSSRARPM